MQIHITNMWACSHMYSGAPADVYCCFFYRSSLSSSASLVSCWSIAMQHWVIALEFQKLLVSLWTSDLKFPFPESSHKTVECEQWMLVCAWMWMYSSNAHNWVRHTEHGIQWTMHTSFHSPIYLCVCVCVGELFYCHVSFVWFGLNWRLKFCFYSL